MPYPGGPQAAARRASANRSQPSQRAGLDPTPAFASFRTPLPSPPLPVSPPFTMGTRLPATCCRTSSRPALHSRRPLLDQGPCRPFSCMPAANTASCMPAANPAGIYRTWRAQRALPAAGPRDSGAPSALLFLASHPCIMKTTHPRHLECALRIHTQHTTHTRTDPTRKLAYVLPSCTLAAHPATPFHIITLLH